MAKYSKKASDKVHKVMHEYKEGGLKSSSGRKVTSRKQAIAIGISEARASGAKVPSKKAASKKSATRKSSSRKTTSKKTSARRTTGRKTTGRKSPVRKSSR